MYEIMPSPGILGSDMCYVCSLQIKDYCTEYGHQADMFFGDTELPAAVMFA
jgi:hypothetical protein